MFARFVRPARWIAVAILASVAVPVSGQNQLPAVGTQLPVVTVVDDQGAEFSTASLRDSYTVLVFGCLT